MDVGIELREIHGAEVQALQLGSRETRALRALWRPQVLPICGRPCSLMILASFELKQHALCFFLTQLPRIFWEQ